MVIMDKRILFVAMVTLFLFAVSCSEQSPLVGQAIEAKNTPTIIAVGESVSGLVTQAQQKSGITPGGVVFYYDLSQQQWQRVPVWKLASQLYFVDVMENGQAYAFTPTVKEKVISSADGGKTWQTESSVVAPRTTERIRKDQFCSENMCLRVGKKVSRGKIARSEDGGKTWKQQAAPINTKLNAVYCSDSLTCWIVGDRLPGKRVGRRQLPSTGPGVIFKTTDGGVTWESLADRSGNLISTKFSDVKDVVVVKFNDVYFVGQIGWVVGDHGMILKTADGGKSWALQATDAYIDYQLQSVVFKDDQTGWLVGGNLRNKGIIAWTTNGGERWDNVEVDGSLNSISVS